MLITNARVFSPDGVFRRTSVLIADDRILQVGDDLEADHASDVMDGTGLLLVPGLIDIHLHGAMNRDFCEGSVEAIQAIAEAELREGVTAFLCANMAQPIEALTTICEAAGAYEYRGGAEFLGINLEAPFISVERCGAQNQRYLTDPDIEVFRRLQRAARGRIKVVGVAPEREGSDAFIAALADEVRVSVAHTDADQETAAQAFASGANHVTHLCNAMRPFLHREPGVLGAAWEAEHALVELICDASFVGPTMMRAVFRLFGPTRTILISDGMPCTGMPDGRYTVGGDTVILTNGTGRMARDGTLAGPARTLMGLLRTGVLECGIRLEDALRSATLTPAQALSIAEDYGSIAPGKYADLVMLDPELKVRAVISRGEVVHDWRVPEAGVPTMAPETNTAELD